MGDDLARVAREAWPGFSVLIAFGRLGPFRIYRETHRLAVLLGWISIDFFTIDAKSMYVEQSRAIKKQAAGLPTGGEKR